MNKLNLDQNHYREEFFDDRRHLDRIDEHWESTILHAEILINRRSSTEGEFDLLSCDLFVLV